MERIDLLVPRPKMVRTTGETWCPDPGRELTIRLPEGSPGGLERRLRRTLEPLGREVICHLSPPHGEADLRLELTSNGQGPGGDDESYRLAVGAAGLRIVASTWRGLGHGLATLGQWLRIHRAMTRRDGANASASLDEVPGLDVEDSPDLAVRGVQLDVSRNKVPRLDTLMALVERLADVKINQLQLYFEHTFAYLGHERVWRNADPLTGEEVEALDRFCHDLGIELVPNQNSFGHFHRWLVHEPYRRLAECPDGIDHPFSDQPEPFSLCPLDPGTLELLADLYDQLLPHFRSKLFNVGLDETLDLGLGRSAEACARQGKERVYLNFVRRVHALVSERGRRMLFWGDVILDHPERIAELPRDVVALDWGYEADHPFDTEARRFAEAGLEFWLCPGTSSWNSLGGRLHNALHNLARATRAARVHGAGGLLITDWGDHGHLQPQPVSYPAFLAGAAFAWRTDLAEDPESLPLAELLDLWFFDTLDLGLGRALVDLGEVDHRTGAPPPGAKGINGSALFFQLIFADRPAAERRGQGMTRRHLDDLRGHLEGLRTALQGFRSANPEHALVARELGWVAELLDLARELADQRMALGEDRPITELPRAARQHFDSTLAELIPRRHGLWLARHRPGGWDLSRAKLERLRGLLAVG